MKFTCVLLCIALTIYTPVRCHQDAFDDNDFAEFEEFDDDDYVSVSPTEDAHKDPIKVDQIAEEGVDFPELDEVEDEMVVEEEDNEFEHFQDEEEFEGFNGAEQIPVASKEQKTAEPSITIATVPLHFRTHWDSYWMEILMIIGLVTYFSNYMVGKSRNAKLANLWLSTHKSLLDENFTIVGDDGKLEMEAKGLMKESDSLYTLWCSGRTCCEGMLVELKMIKRQDLVSILAGIMKPTQDQIHIKVELSKDSMDTFVFCVGAKKTATKLFKEMSDLSKFCTLVNKSDDKYNVPSRFSVLSELPESSLAILDSRVVLALHTFEDYIEYIHISDQYCGVIQQEDNSVQLKQPEVKRMLIATFNIPSNHNMESVKPMLVLVFYILERIKRFRLSKEAKTKADKNRLRVEEDFLKSTHAARAEAAAQRREDKRKQEKERVFSDEDPEKQRRWEQKEQKRQNKKKAPKMKQLSIKAF